MSDADWPTVPPNLSDKQKAEYKRARFDAELDARKKALELQDTRIGADEQAENDVNKAFFDAVFEVAKGTIDRARSGAETVQKASAAIMLIYTSLLGLVFSVSERPLPSRGVIPALFFGFAVVMSTAYMAYLSTGKRIAGLGAKPSRREAEIERARTLIAWTRATAMHNAYALRVSVLALGVGLAFLPAPFVTFGASSSGDGQTVTPVQQDWPEPSARAGANVELQKILYEAQVAEAAEARKQEVAEETPIAEGHDATWWKAALAAFLFMLIAPSGKGWPLKQEKEDTDAGVA
jgi:hypothetical protein